MMNEQNYNQDSSNWNYPGSNVGGKKLPNSNGSFVLGIITLCVSVLCWCCYGGFAGLITGIIGIVLGSKAIRTYQENPGVYTEKSFKKAKAGRTMSWIGLILSILACAAIVTYVYLGLTDQLPPQFQEQFDKSKEGYDFD